MICNKVAIKCLFLSLLILLASCFSVKPGTSKSGAKYFETFFVGAEGTQYFIKPLTFENRQSDEILVVDITFRYKSNLVDSAVVNFSIVGAEIYKSLNSLILTSGTNDVTSDKLYFLFNEAKGDAYLSRFTTKVAMVDLFPVINTNSWQIEVICANNKMIFTPQSKSEKALEQLHSKLFVLMAAE